MTKQAPSNMPEWDDLQALWQESPEVDVEAMAKKARFVWWRMRVNFLFEVTLCFAGFGFFGWAIITGQASEKLGGMPFAVLFALLCLLGVWAAFYIRRGAWGIADESVVSVVQLQIKRTRSSIRYIVVNNWGCAIGLLLFAFLYWAAYEKYGPFPDPKLMKITWAMGAAALFFVGFPIVSLSFFRRKKNELARLLELAQQLAETDEAN